MMAVYFQFITQKYKWQLYFRIVSLIEVDKINNNALALIACFLLMYIMSYFS